MRHSHEWFGALIYLEIFICWQFPCGEKNVVDSGLKHICKSHVMMHSCALILGGDYLAVNVNRSRESITN